MVKNKPTVGIIGAGRLGTALARLLSAAGYGVAITNSRGAASLTLQLQILLPKVEVRDVGQLINEADIIILALPLRRYTTLPLDYMSKKIVIDAMNYWASIDGTIPEFEQYAGSSSELVAASISGARVVKTANSVAYNELEEHSLPPDDPKRRAIPLASDDVAAKEIVAELITDIGFDPVDLGALKNGRLFQPGTPLFNQRLSKTQIESSVQH